MTLNPDFARDARLTKVAIEILTSRYLTEEETSPQEAFVRAAKAFADNEDHAKRIYDYVSKGWMMFSSPIISNGGTERGMPISCFGGYVDDSREGITGCYTETSMLTSMGGGTSGYWGHIRSDGQKTSKGSSSTGLIPFLKVVDSLMLAFSQGSTRRGSYAGYIDISHPEIEEFMHIRKPTGGDINRKSLFLHHGVIIPDTFMEAVKAGDDWDLIDPHSKEVTKTIPARTLWQTLLEMRVETGEPYIVWRDASNEARPQPWKDKGLEIHNSNLCTEIFLPVNEERTFVCCLSSLNIEYYDEWKDTNIVRDCIRFLDNVIEFFIHNAHPSMARAIESAKNSRDLGLGAMGFHSFLQKKGVPFESVIAKSWNKKIFKFIKEEAVKESELLAEERGVCPDAEGYEDFKRRNMNLLAIAPNATSGVINGCSPSIEPIRANIFTQKTLSGNFTIKNHYLEAVLEKYGKNDKETWKSINAVEGSVQHLDFLTDLERDLFKTAPEINQHWIVEHVADRQPYICQGQSTNLFFVVEEVEIEKTSMQNVPATEKDEELYKQYIDLLDEGKVTEANEVQEGIEYKRRKVTTKEKSKHIPAEYIDSVHMKAWESGCKALYYCRSEAEVRVENVSNKVERQHLTGKDDGECLSCEG